MTDVHVERDVSVEMRDGVGLATDIYRPPQGDPAPTLIHRIPYDKSFAWYIGSLMFNPLTAVERGYAVVVQDTRGRFNSNGKWEPFVHEADDGYDTIEWAADQPWSNGRTGIYGSSYMGVTTWQAAVADPPHLEAAVAYLTGGDYHDGFIYSGGAFELGFNLHWAVGLGWDTLTRLELSDEVQTQVRETLISAYKDLEGAASYRPLKEMPGVSTAAPYWVDWLDHAAYDDYWADVDVTAHANNVQVPVLHVTGWFDQFLRGHLDIHEALEASREGDEGPAHRMLVGPWDHGAYLSSTANQVGDRRYGPDVAGGASFMQERTLSWFDHWLKDEPIETGKASGVGYFDLSRATWEESESWPPSNDDLRLYLGSDGQANGRAGDGVLLEAPPEQAPPDSYLYDPMDPVPTVGGRAYIPEVIRGGILDQSEVEMREDVLVYTSPRLTEPISIAGPVTVQLYAASSAPDTDFTAKLVDVEPDGYCGVLADGIIRARYRDEMKDPAPLNPGETYTLDVDCWSVAHTFNKGHRIRLEVSSSNFPRFDPHPNVYGSLADVIDDEVQTATQRVYHDSERPSHLSLPIIE